MDTDDTPPSPPPPSGSNALAVVEELHGIISPKEIGERIRDLIYAKRKNRAGEMVDDTRANESGMKLWLAYSVGLPVQRQEIIQHTIGETPDQLRARLKDSPAMRRAFRKMMDEIDAEEDAVEA